MKVSLGELKRVMEYMRYHVHGEDRDLVDISLKEEDIENNKLVSCLTISVSASKEPSSYDTIQTTKTVTTSIEVFAHHENRAPILTTSESRHLSQKI